MQQHNYHPRNPANDQRCSTGRIALLLLALLALGLAGCGQSVQPGRTQHRLYAWDCPGAPGGRAYLVLRYQDRWTSARDTTRVGLIRFRIDPQPSLIDSQYIWGVPIDSEEYVLFDATRNRILRRTDYLRQVNGLGAGRLAFADRQGLIEVVRPDGQVIIPASARYTDVQMAFQQADGTAVLALARGGRWDLLDSAGQAVAAEPLLTTLDFSMIEGP